MHLDNISFNAHCHSALRLLATDDAHYNNLHEAFMQFSIAPDLLLHKLRVWHPWLMWSQLQDVYPNFTSVLVDTSKAPAFTLGIELYDKLAKRMHPSRRGKMREGMVESQVAVSHSGDCLIGIWIEIDRPLRLLLQHLCVLSVASISSSAMLTSIMRACWLTMEWYDDGMRTIEAAVVRGGGPLEIDDPFFNDHAK